MAEPEPTVVVDDLHVVYRVYEDRIGGVKQFLAGKGHRPRAREIRAVRGVSFTLYEGESVGIIGSNGSGKSTLLSALTGLLPAESGSIRVRSRPTLLGVGAVMRPALSGRRNILIGGLALGLTKQEITEKADSIVDFAGLEEFIDLPMRTFSSGMRARLMFAIATAMIPEILLVDEALAVGDHSFRRRSQDRIDTIRDRAGTVVLVSHNLSEMVDTCDRVLWMDRGEMVAGGAPEEIIAQYEASTRVELHEDRRVLDRLDRPPAPRRPKIAAPVGDAATATRTAVLHIGGPWTGTSDIQRYLGHHEDDLRRAGYVTPSFLSHRNHFAYASYASSRAAELLGLEAGDRWQAWRDEFEVDALDAMKGQENWIISSEHLASRIERDQVDVLGELLERAGFERLEVIVYVRRQDELAARTHVGRMIDGHTTQFDIDEHIDNEWRYDWEQLIRRWRASEYVDRVRVRLFPDRDEMPDVVTDFCRQLDISSVPSKAAVKPELDALGVQFLRQLNAAIPRVDEATGDLFLDVRNPTPALAAAAMGDPFELSGPDAEAIMNAYAVSNAWVLEQVDESDRIDDYFAPRPPGQQVRAELTLDDAVRYAAAMWRFATRRK